MLRLRAEGSLDTLAAPDSAKGFRSLTRPLMAVTVSIYSSSLPLSLLAGWVAVFGVHQRRFSVRAALVQPRRVHRDSLGLKDRCGSAHWREQAMLID